uniref:Uncharacterized protein n=1 Tax=Paramoeba aestuarina TaxID=180227 RepID=A0A7S4UYM6_9EUKA
MIGNNPKARRIAPFCRNCIVEDSPVKGKQHVGGPVDNCNPAAAFVPVCTLIDSVLYGDNLYHWTQHADGPKNGWKRVLSLQLSNKESFHFQILLARLTDIF